VVDVAAPGGDFAFGTSGGVLSTLNSGTRAPGSDTLARYQGTSMATPHIAGIAALLYEAKPDGGGDPGTGFEPINFSVSVPRISRNNFRHYTLNVPAGASVLNVNINGGTGDADLYIRFGARPTTNSWDFRPFLDGSNESVSVDNPQEGTWYISVRAFATVNGLTLSGSLE
jgi:serine protease